MEITPSQEELTRKQAYELGVMFKQGVAIINSAWVRLAEVAYRIKEMQAWRLMGIDTYGEWLADPDINMKRRDFDRLVELHREYVLAREIDPERLARVDKSKALLVLGAVKAGDTTVEQALDDAEALGYRDLRVEYGQEPEPAVGTVPCPSCGSMVAPGRLEDG